MINDQLSLLVLSGVQGDPRRYRTFHLYEQACLANLNCQLSHVTDPAIRKKIKASNIVLIHRASYDSLIAWIVEEIRRKDGILIFDIDDLVFDMDAIKFIDSPDFADPVRQALYQENIQLTRRTLEFSNTVTTSGKFLMQRVKQLGKPAHVHRNAFSSEMLVCSENAYHNRKTKQRQIVIGYASGTPTHDQDFALIKPSLKSVLSRHPDAKLVLVGTVDPGRDWGNVEGQIRRISRLPWRKLPEIQVQFDINLAPLRMNNPFGQSKSEIKYVEAGLLRVPTIASSNDAFKQAIRHEDNGFLAEDSEEWEGLLEKLIAQPQMRIEMGERAHRDVLQRYHPNVRSRELVELVNLITNNRYKLAYTDSPATTKAERLQLLWRNANLERTPTLIQRAWYTVRYRNFATLVKQVWIYFRRMVAPIFPYRALP
jgi:glycosyltransferase involved in cell wall biosynthesis